MPSSVSMTRERRTAWRRILRVVSKHVEDILLASEDDIVEATQFTWQRMKIVMEPSSAVPLATILKNKRIFG